jgi:Flp pilus assembly protein TadG
VEAVLVIPVLMLILLAIIQFVLWAHAAQVVQSAAAEGDRSARSLGSSPAAGVARAQSIVDAPGSDISASRVAESESAGAFVQIAVTGHAVSILPGLSLPVSAAQIGPMQEFRGSE